MSEDIFGATQSFGDATELDAGALTEGELEDPFVIPRTRRKGGEGRKKQFAFYDLDADVVSARYPYEHLANLVLGANQDVKFHRSLTDRASADKYAKAHRLTLGADKDYNNDGINDVILFNKWGDPVVINGHALANTDYPYRKEFYKANPKKSDRMRAGGYNQWLRTSFIPSNEEVIKGWGKKGIKVRSVREGHSTRVDVNADIKTNISTVFKSLLGENVGKFVLSLVPWFQLCSYVYDAIILRYIISVKAPNLAREASSLDDFKKILKSKNVKTLVDGFLRSEECGTLLRARLNVPSVQALGNMMTGGMDKFIQSIRDVGAKIEDYSTNPELRLQKQIWKEQLAANVDNMREQLDAELGSIIASK